MALAGLMEIMDEMADQIRAAVVAVTDVDVQVEPRMIVNPTPPCIDLWVGDQARDQLSAAFDELGAYLFTVRARVGTPDHVAGQDLLLSFMDDTNDLSIARALLDDDKLNGYAASLDVRDQTGYVEYPTVEGSLLGFQMTVAVLAGDS